ncbi:MAG: transglutaminase domain-containing protein [Actinobacteria bacterium]|nr:transglutaminase domain-containing protein [Actinomycetota bacterium]
MTAGRRPAAPGDDRRPATEPPRPALLRLPLLVRLVLALVWLFVVLYPDPTVLVRSIGNLRALPVDAAAVARLTARLPDDPVLIERIVLDRIVPYGYDWRVSDVPWYFPTTGEVLAEGRGDCESRALVLASILEAKGIPHRLVMSLDHIWVDYPGKQENALENDAVAIAGQDDDGSFVFGWPADFDPLVELDDQVTILWEPMPWPRKLLLFAGLLLALGWNAFSWRAGERLGVVRPPAVPPRRRSWRRLRRRRRPLDAPAAV